VAVLGSLLGSLLGSVLGSGVGSLLGSLWASWRGKERYYFECMLSNERYYNRT
jgi:hypothetical protein